MCSLNPASCYPGFGFEEGGWSQEGFVCASLAVHDLGCSSAAGGIKSLGTSPMIMTLSACSEVGIVPGALS